MKALCQPDDSGVCTQCDLPLAAGLRRSCKAKQLSFRKVDIRPVLLKPIDPLRPLRHEAIKLEPIPRPKNVPRPPAAPTFDPTRKKGCCGG